MREHIQLYANVKGQPVDSEFEAKTKGWLQQLDLLEKSDDLASNLSGGQIHAMPVRSLFAPRLIPTGRRWAQADHATKDGLKRHQRGEQILSSEAAT